MIKSFALIILGFLTALATPSAADSFALIVTAETYANAGSLKNPTNDGAVFGALLESLGFSVATVSDADLSTMHKAIDRISDEAGEADDVLIFFAGHGVSFEDQSLLLPIDADLASKRALMRSSLPLRDLLQAAGKARRLGMVFSDACRNDPSMRLGPDGSRSVRVLADGFTTDAGLGLPADDEVTLLEAEATGGGTYIVGLSTAAGSVASDGSGLNSPFTIALVRALQRSRSAEEIGEAITQDVISATNGRQRPIFKAWRHQ